MFLKEKLNLLKQTIEDTQESYILSKDTDARTGHKSADSSFFGYKTHIGMREERIITAAVGIENMQMQGALAIFTVNLKRILNLKGV